MTVVYPRSPRPSWRNILRTVVPCFVAFVTLRVSRRALLSAMWTTTTSGAFGYLALRCTVDSPSCWTQRLNLPTQRLHTITKSYCFRSSVVMPVEVRVLSASSAMQHRMVETCFSPALWTGLTQVCYVPIVAKIGCVMVFKVCG